MICYICTTIAITLYVYYVSLSDCPRSTALEWGYIEMYVSNKKVTSDK